MQGYQNLRVLGQGTFGRCYLVVNRSTQQLCVIKQIDIKGLSQTQKLNTRREACILQALDHPNIIKYIGTFDSKPGFLNIVMSYADGGDLGKKIKQAKGAYFSENIILGWFTQICLAIKHIHERKFIHRDLKCENIFMTKDNLVKLGDFGIARSLKQSLEKAKTVVGTPYYMSPEICDSKDYTAKTDIWSLGVVLYEICCLKPPFQSSSLTSLALKICKGQYTSIPNFYSKDLKKLIADLLTVDPKFRPNINQVMKSSIIQSRIETYLNLFEKHEVEQNVVVVDTSINQSRKIEKIKSPISPKLVNNDNSSLLIMLPTSPTNNLVKEGKIKISDMKKGKIPSGRKREISEPVHSPRQLKQQKQSKKFISQVQRQDKFQKQLQKLQRKKPTLPLEIKSPKGKKIQQNILLCRREKQLSQQQQQSEEMSQSFMFEQIPVEFLKQGINNSSEKNLIDKRQEFENSVSMIFKKYERESLELEFNGETQSETLEGMLVRRLGGKDRFDVVVDIVKRGAGFPGEHLLGELEASERELVPLISMYYGAYVLNMI